MCLAYLKQLVSTFLNMTAADYVPVNSNSGVPGNDTEWDTESWDDWGEEDEHIPVIDKQVQLTEVVVDNNVRGEEQQDDHQVVVEEDAHLGDEYEDQGFDLNDLSSMQLNPDLVNQMKGSMERRQGQQTKDVGSDPVAEDEEPEEVQPDYFEEFGMTPVIAPPKSAIPSLVTQPPQQDEVMMDFSPQLDNLADMGDDDLATAGAWGDDDADLDLDDL